jgi:hypothetical protein
MEMVKESRGLNVISTEIRLVKYPPGKDNIIQHLIKAISRHAKSETSYVIFRTFGWFDYLILVINPRVRCLLPVSSEESISQRDSEKYLNSMVSSFMCWYEVDINDYTLFKKIINLAKNIGYNVGDLENLDLDKDEKFFNEIAREINLVNNYINGNFSELCKDLEKIIEKYEEKGKDTGDLKETKVINTIVSYLEDNYKLFKKIIDWVKDEGHNVGDLEKLDRDFFNEIARETNLVNNYINGNFSKLHEDLEKIIKKYKEKGKNIGDFRKSEVIDAIISYLKVRRIFEDENITINPINKFILDRRIAEIIKNCISDKEIKEKIENCLKSNKDILISKKFKEDEENKDICNIEFEELKEKLDKSISPNNNEKQKLEKIKNLLEKIDHENHSLFKYVYCIGRDSEGIFILSFIKINEKESNNLDGNEFYRSRKYEIKKELEKLKNDEVIRDYVVFDYMGVWDFVVLVYVIDVSRIYEYKKKFLLKNRYNLIIQSSSMILAPATELPFYID